MISNYIKKLNINLLNISKLVVSWSYVNKSYKKTRISK